MNDLYKLYDFECPICFLFLFRALRRLYLIIFVKFLFCGEGLVIAIYVFTFLFSSGAALSVVLSNLCILILVIILIAYRKSCRQSWINWTRECLFDWKDYMLLALPGLAMLFFEWTNFEVGIVASGRPRALKYM